MNPAFGRRWNDEDLATLSEFYATEGAEGVMARTGRSLYSIRVKASRLGLTPERHWTDEEEKRLAMLWGDVSLSKLAKDFGRTQKALKRRAQALGLKLGAPDGYEYVTAAAKRTGFKLETLRRILAWAEETGAAGDGDQHIERLPWSPRHSPKSRWRQHVVEVFEVDAAVEAWLAAETVEAAARDRGMSGPRLRRILEAFGTDVPTRPRETRHWRVPTVVIDRAVAAAEAARAPQARAA